VPRDATQATPPLSTRTYYGYSLPCSEILDIWIGCLPRQIPIVPEQWLVLTLGCLSHSRFRYVLIQDYQGKPLLKDRYMVSLTEGCNRAIITGCLFMDTRLTGEHRPSSLLNRHTVALSTYVLRKKATRQSFGISC
jgi:hypothetical protein